MLVLLLGLEGFRQGVAGAGLLRRHPVDVAQETDPPRLAARHVPGLVKGGEGFASDVGDLRLNLGIQHHQPHLCGLTSSDDLGETLLAGLHLVAGDPDEALLPTHGAPPARICSRREKASGRLVTSSLS